MLTRRPHAVRYGTRFVIQGNDPYAGVTERCRRTTGRMDSAKGACEAVWRYTRVLMHVRPQMFDSDGAWSLEPGSVSCDNLALSLDLCTPMWMAVLTIDQDLARKMSASLSCVSTRCCAFLGLCGLRDADNNTVNSPDGTATATLYSPHVKLVLTKMSTSAAQNTHGLVALRSRSRRGCLSREALFMR